MAADQSVFVPDQSHNENIEDRQHNEAGAVRIREAVELVDNEEAKHDKRNWIGPDRISKQTNDEEHLDNAVAEEIEGRVEIVGYDNVQFAKAPNVLRGMGLTHLSKNAAAIKELKDKGMSPD